MNSARKFNYMSEAESGSESFYYPSGGRSTRIMDKLPDLSGTPGGKSRRYPGRLPVVDAESVHQDDKSLNPARNVHKRVEPVIHKKKVNGKSSFRREQVSGDGVHEHRDTNGGGSRIPFLMKFLFVIFVLIAVCAGLKSAIHQNEVVNSHQVAVNNDKIKAAESRIGDINLTMEELEKQAEYAALALAMQKKEPKIEYIKSDAVQEKTSDTDTEALKKTAPEQTAAN